MTPVLFGKGLLLEGSNPKIEDIHRFQVYIELLDLKGGCQCLKI